MSYSVASLFKAVAQNAKIPEGQLDNPDIPSFNQAGGERLDTKFIRDQAYNALRLTSAPRNGEGFLLPRSTFSDNPKHDAFLLDGAIDPNVIRQRVNPISEAAPGEPNSEYSLYGADRTMETSNDQVDLIQRARNGLYNYKNRFNVLPPTTPAGGGANSSFSVGGASSSIAAMPVVARSTVAV